MVTRLMFTKTLRIEKGEIEEGDQKKLDKSMGNLVGSYSFGLHEITEEEKTKKKLADANFNLQNRAPIRKFVLLR